MIENIEIYNKVIDTLIIRSTLNGSLQRARIYILNVEDHKKKDFRISLSKIMSDTLNKILQKENYCDEKHCEIITNFAEEVSSLHGNILIGNRLRIGTAQKLINLYWKMSWLLKKDVAKPIHCPFDSVIIQELDPCVKHIRWTQFDSIEDYNLLVEAAKKKGAIADWELNYYIKRINCRSLDLI